MNIAEKLRGLRERAGLSRDKLAKRAGYERGTSLARYEDPDYMQGRKIPAEIVAKLALAMEGRGSPPVTRSEVWQLAEPGSSMVVSHVAVTSIPVMPWETVRFGVEMLKTAERIESVDVAGLPRGDHVAITVSDDHCERVAAKGALIIVDLSDRELRDGRRYVVLVAGEPMVRRYQTNPERWESEAVSPAPTIYPRQAVEVIGRVIRSLKEW
jgi:DNA-binding XRE family transcriptional regulator